MGLTQLFLDGLADRRGRRDGSPAVVNVGSTARSGDGPYCSPKHAAANAGLVRFTTSLRDPAVTSGARVMAVVPGWVDLERAERQRRELTSYEKEGVGAPNPAATT